MPKQVQTVDGKDYYLIDGDAYDPSGRKCGHIEGDKIYFEPGYQRREIL